jgi:hypothetical protein
MGIRHLIQVFSILTLGLLGLISNASAQTYYRADGIALYNNAGTAAIAAGATVTVCAQTATGTPCSPLATIYSTSTGLPSNNPFNADISGNYYFYAAPGIYQVQVGGVGFQTYTYNDQVISNDPVNPTFGNVTLNNLTINGTCTGCGGGGGGSGTVQPGTQYVIPMYPNTGSNAIVGPSTIFTDPAGDLTSPANITARANQYQVGPYPTIDAAAFGVLSDATTDDTVALQNATNAACALNSIGTTGTTGWTVGLPSGGTVITDHGTEPSGTTYGVLIPCRGVRYTCPSKNYYNCQLQYKSNPTIWGNAVQLGHPKEAIITSITRSGNVVTLNFATMAPAFVVTTGSGGPNMFHIQGVTGGSTSFDGDFAIATATATSATYAQTGANESGTVSSSALAISWPDNALEYDGTGGHFSDTNVEVTCLGTNHAALANGLGNYVLHTGGIWDWRGGYVNLDSFRLGENCEVAFGGVQSQLDYIVNTTTERNKIGYLMSVRSDTSRMIGNWDQADDLGIYQNGTANLSIIGQNGASCSPGSYWYRAGNKVLPNGPPELLVESQMRRVTRGGYFFGDWSENDAATGVNCAAIFGIGIGDLNQVNGGLGTSDIMVQGFMDQNSRTVDFMQIDQADHIQLNYIAGYTNSITGAMVHVVNNGQPCQAADVTLTGISLEQSYTPFTDDGCTPPGSGQLPTLQWIRNFSGQYQIQQFNRNCGFVGIQLLQGNFGLTGCPTSQANLFANAGTGQVSSLELLQNSVDMWRLRANASGNGDFLDVVNGNFPRFTFNAGGGGVINNLGTGTLDINGTGGSGTGGINMHSAGGAVTTTWGAGGAFAPLQLTQLTANNYAGTLTLSGGVATRTFATAYNNPPICTGSDSTANNSVKVTTTATTISMTGTGTDVINYICVGNPN